MRALGRLLAMGEFIASSPMLQRAGHRIKRVMIVFCSAFHHPAVFSATSRKRFAQTKVWLGFGTFQANICGQQPICAWLKGSVFGRFCMVIRGLAATFLQTVQLYFLTCGNRLALVCANTKLCPGFVQKM
jgi:hypothetical protein